MDFTLSVKYHMLGVATGNAAEKNSGAKSEFSRKESCNQLVMSAVDVDRSGYL
jgi:hypothetical protein